MRTVLTLMTVCMMIFATTLSRAETIEISAATYPPITTEGVFEGIGHGMHADMVIAIIKKAGHEPKFVYVPFKRMLHAFGTGKVPFLCTSFRTMGAAKISRDMVESLSLGFFNNYYYYFMSHHDKKINYKTPPDLKGYRVCLVLGSYVIPVLEQAGATVETSKDGETNMKKMYMKRCDLLGDTDLSASYYIRKLYPDKVSDLVHNDPTSSSQDEMGLMCFKSNAAAVKLMKELAAAYEVLQKDGTILEIMKKYWGGDVPKESLPLSMQ